MAVKEHSFDKDLCMFPQNVCLDFLSLNNIYMNNFFVNKLTKMGIKWSIWKPFQILVIRALSDV